MDVNDRHFAFAGGRFVAVVALCAVVGLAVVEFVRPERYFRTAAATAEIELRVESAPMPTAENVRRRALSTANLTAVLRRLSGRDATEPAATNDDDASAATLDGWRRRIAVDVRPDGQSDRCRVRFLAIDARSPSEGEILVEAVAAQYAGELAAERYYERVDRLRAAEERVSAAAVDLLDVVRGRSAADLRGLSLGSRWDEADEELPSNLGGELERLTQMRTRLLETLQPAHPEVAALDARLDVLRMAAAGSTIRRLSAEEELAVPPARPLSTAGLPAAVDGAVEHLNDARSSMRARLNDLLDPAAAELPVVSTKTGAQHVWELRSFWYGAACLPGLAVAWLTSRRRRQTRAMPTAIPVVTQIEASPTAVVETTPEDDTLRTLEQAAAAIGAPILGVILRRRERQAAPFTTK